VHGGPHYNVHGYVRVPTSVYMGIYIYPYILVGVFGHGSGPSASRALAGLGKCCSEVGMKSALQTARKISSRRLQK